MKIISYSLFGADKFNDDNRFEFKAYLRGFYWNVRMNKLIYPDWHTNLETDEMTYGIYQGLLDWLVNNHGLIIHVNNKEQERDPLCKAMLWRMKAVFNDNVTHVLCRDTDAITTYREAKCVQLWLESGLDFHAILDNPAHGGMMGGMVGFETAQLKAKINVPTWRKMLESSTEDFSKRGSDQHFMNKKLYPLIKDQLYVHQLAGSRLGGARVEQAIIDIQLPQVDKKLWESDLTCRHIGSAGVVEMELIRFFQRFDPSNNSYKAIENEYSDVFYWRLKR